MLLKISKFTSFKLKLLYSHCLIFLGRLRSRNKTKYFCVGRNKTGTTSLKQAFEQLGFVVGYQKKAEILYDHYYFEDNFEPIIRYCKSAQVFQDVPFSCPETFKYLDKAFPGSKFILTVRNDAEQWYQSITRFHAKQFGSNGNMPTIDELKEAFYIRKGMPYNTVRLHGTQNTEPYNEKIMKSHYEKHNLDVMEYFKERPNDLLILNLADEGAYQRFVDFLGVQSPFSEFPWENRT